MFEKSGKHRCLRLRNAGISHAHPIEPNRAINRDRCRDGRLALALVQGSGISTRILTAQYLHLSFARDGRLSDPSRKDTHGNNYSGNSCVNALSPAAELDDRVGDMTFLGGASFHWSEAVTMASAEKLGPFLTRYREDRNSNQQLPAT